MQSTINSLASIKSQLLAMMHNAPRGSQYSCQLLLAALDVGHAIRLLHLNDTATPSTLQPTEKK